MYKLPVFATAARAYQFLLHDAGTILRLSWLPLLIVAIAQYFVSRAQFGAMRAAIEAGNLRAIGRISPPWPWQLLDVVMVMFGTAVVAAALHRVILLGDRNVHLAFGRTEVLFAMLPFIFALPIVLWTVFVFAIVGVTIATGMQSAWVTVLLLVAGVLVVLTVAMLRFGIMFPITVIEDRYDFVQAWVLTRGNFWRIVALGVIVSVPFVIVTLPVDVATGSFSDFGKGSAKQAMAMLERKESFLVVRSIVNYVLSIVGGALVVAMLSYSYKALRGLGYDAVWTPER